MKVRLSESYPGSSLPIGMGITIFRGDPPVEVLETFELEQAISQGYIVVEKEKAEKGNENGKKKEIWVVAEYSEGRLSDASLELASKAAELARKSSMIPCAVVIGDDADHADAHLELKAHGIGKEYIAAGPKLKDYNTSFYTKVLHDAIKKHKPEIVLFPATAQGRDLAPRLAMRIGTGLTADCTGLSIEDGLLIQTKPSFGGNILAEIICEKKRPQMATVRPGVFLAEKKLKEADFEQVELDVDIKDTDPLAVLKSRRKAEICAGSIRDAQIIVAGGRGMSTKENFMLLERLASMLCGSVAATRPAVDLGWAEKSVQIGQTGEMVKPRVYIACGISGAIQHTIGMQKSDLIIAINKDKDAPIHQIADYSIVADAREAVNRLIEELGKEN